MREKIIELNAEYAAAIDDGRLEDWPSFFTTDCFYRITTSHNYSRGYEAGVVYCDSRQMLADRVLSLRKANIFERQTYRHLISLPRLLESDGSNAVVETGFAVLRTMRTGETAVFASGRYLDRIVQEGTNTLRFSRRDVVCDSHRIDTLLALPL
jgi:hypothetical protein